MIYPYLPASRASLFIGDCNIPNAKTIIPPRLASLPYSMQKHTDLGICPVSKDSFVCAPETFLYYKDILSGYGFKVVQGNLCVQSHYPGDCAYNVGIVGKRCFLNKDITDRILINLLEKNGYSLIHVKQGYSKCSICPIDENTIITGDASISKEAEKTGIEVIKCTNESIILEGFSSGFIGGCMCMQDKKTLLVNGELNHYKDGLYLSKKLGEKGISALSLKKGELVDIGSIIPLMAT